MRRVTPATALPGRETWPALSPDGGQLAFAARLADPGNADLYLQSVAGGSPVRLTDDPGIDSAPAWSPDGSRIAFSRSADGQPCRILVMTVPAGQPQQVGQCRDAPWTQPAWTPDGKSIIFPDRPGIVAPFQLYRLALDDGRVTPLTRALARTWGHDRPTVSPDGRRVAFVDTPAWSVQDVQVLDLLDGTVRRVTNEGGEIGGLAWLRDGSLVFSSARQGDRGLWTLAPGAEVPRRLLAGVQDLRRLSSARHADRLAVESWTFHANLSEITLDPGGSPVADTSGKRLTFATAADHDPDLAPDGSLAFISTRSGTPEIWVKPTAGEPRKLTELGGTSISSVRWSPDGTRLAFAAARAGNYDVFTVGADGSGLKRWTEEMEEDLSPVWAADGQSLYFTSRRTGFWRLWSLDLSSGEALPLTGDGPMTVRASPDGQAIYYAKEGESGIWRRSLDGSEDEVLVIPDFAYQDWPNWTIADGMLWYVLRGRPGGAVLVRAGLDGQGAQAVATLSRFYAMSGLAVRPDGRSVILSSMVIDEADIHLVDLARHD
ncbi:hypothetical protein HHL28_04490 [Aerophototrophica crusticola]|uniref:Uncharacterized protein n=2 Tax=Aerophototrophica crusticola TaxID=1709002 RepID=A0A858R4Z3_9PROT|nr:hypothetical protein HHL28_04490 [Rhodospirillaceae bacterium B3]